jgi:hypothetical protein
MNKPKQKKFEHEFNFIKFGLKNQLNRIQTDSYFKKVEIHVSSLHSFCLSKTFNLKFISDSIHFIEGFSFLDFFQVIKSKY